MRWTTRIAQHASIAFTLTTSLAACVDDESSVDTDTDAEAEVTRTVIAPLRLEASAQRAWVGATRAFLDADEEPCVVWMTNPRVDDGELSDLGVLEERSASGSLAPRFSERRWAPPHFAGHRAPALRALEVSAVDVHVSAFDHAWRMHPRTGRIEAIAEPFWLSADELLASEQTRIVVDAETPEADGAGDVGDDEGYRAWSSNAGATPGRPREGEPCSASGDCVAGEACMLFEDGGFAVRRCSAACYPDVFDGAWCVDDASCCADTSVCTADFHCEGPDQTPEQPPQAPPPDAGTQGSNEGGGCGCGDPVGDAVGEGCMACVDACTQSADATNDAAEGCAGLCSVGGARNLSPLAYYVGFAWFLRRRRRSKADRKTRSRAS